MGRGRAAFGSLVFSRCRARLGEEGLQIDLGNGVGRVFEPETAPDWRGARWKTAWSGKRM